MFCVFTFVFRTVFFTNVLEKSIYFNIARCIGGYVIHNFAISTKDIHIAELRFPHYLKSNSTKFDAYRLHFKGFEISTNGSEIFCNLFNV